MKKFWNWIRDEGGSRTYQIFQGAETGGYKYVPDTVGQQCRSSDSG